MGRFDDNREGLLRPLVDAKDGMDDSPSTAPPESPATRPKPSLDDISEEDLVKELFDMLNSQPEAQEPTGKPVVLETIETKGEPADRHPIEDQQEWPDGSSPADDWDAKATKRVLDELVSFAEQYRTSESFKVLLKFVADFRSYSPYNAMLVRIQMPGACYVAPAYRWRRDYGRTIKVDARPLVILQPMAPVMFVFDVSDTEPGKDAKPLPPEVEKPFEVRGGHLGYELKWTVQNAKRDGIRIQPRKEGSQSGGSIQPASGGMLYFDAGNDRKGNPKLFEVPLRYEILLNQGVSKESQYASIAHELAHLYCGHLGSPNPKWWPDRRGLKKQVEEFEAESVAYLVCARIGIDNPSEQYLAGYFDEYGEVPEISVDTVMTVAGLIEKMGRGRMKPRGKSE